MSKLPFSDPTVNAIYKAIEDNHNERPRTYLGASVIGHSCARYLWYSFRQVKSQSFTGQQLNLFKTGFAAEDRFVADLRKAGVKVHEVDPETGKQYSISYHGSHFLGNTDGAALGIKGQPEVWHLLEFKTHNDRSFKLLQKDGMAKSKPMHYAQMQVYMKGRELMFGYYLAKNKNNDELYGEVVHYNPEAAQAYVDRAGDIIFSSEPSPRVSDNPSWYECKWCHYSDYCHGTGSDLPPELPNVNCRTCIHSTPKQDGTWLCERHDKTLRTTDACDDHKFIPNLFPDLSFERADNDNVFYRGRSGEAYNNSGKGVIRNEHSQW